MKALETLERKLNWWDMAKKKIAVVAAAACCTGLITGIAYPYLSKNAGKQTVRKELVEDPVPEIDVTGIRKECLDDVVVSGAYKKHEQMIQKVSESTGVPKYVLASIVEDGCSAIEGEGAIHYSWDGFVKITAEEAGLKSNTLGNDPEQCLLSAAGKYKKLLDNVKDEETALGLFFANEENIVSAKKKARVFMGIMSRYEHWRKDCSPEVLKLYDPLMEQIDNEKDWNKREALVKEMMQLWDSFLPGTPRGMLTNEAVYRVLTARKYHRKGQWWPEQMLNDNGIKIALRLKRDGYR